MSPCQIKTLRGALWFYFYNLGQCLYCMVSTNRLCGDYITPLFITVVGPLTGGPNVARQFEEMPVSLFTIFAIVMSIFMLGYSGLA